MTQKKIKHRRTQAERSDLAVSALRAAAMELLLESGLSGFSLVAVGDRAGYSRGIVHYHFGSKEALFADLLQSLMIAGQEAFRDVEGRGIAGLQEIVHLLKVSVETAPRETLARILLLNEASSSVNPDLHGLAVKYNQSIRQSIAAVMHSEGLHPPILQLTPEETAVQFLGVIRGIHVQWLAERDEFDVIAALDALRRLLPGWAKDAG